MADITIPPAALEAAQEAMAEHIAGHASKKVARAACLAMLKAWPGVRLGKYRDVAGPNDRIILPLLQEK